MPIVFSRQVDSYELAAHELAAASPAELTTEIEDLMRVGISLYESLHTRAIEISTSSSQNGVLADAGYAREFFEAYRRLAGAFEQTDALIQRAEAEGLSVRDVPQFREASLQVRSLAQFDYDRLLAAANYDGPRRTHAEVRDALRRHLAIDSR